MKLMENLYVHQLDPFLIQFTETIGVRWYGLAYLTGFFIAYLTTYYMAKKGTISIKPERAGDFITYMAIGTLAGGRLGYCLFYGPHLFWTFSSSFPFWGVLEVHKGGMASHGGILGVMLAAYIFARKEKTYPLHILDLTVFGGSIGIFFGRIANFINGELYGREVREAISWAVQFPQEIYTWGASQKDKLSQLADVVEKLPGSEQIGRNQWLEWVSQYSSYAQSQIIQVKEQIVLATQNHNPEVIAALQQVLTPRYPSQLIQAALEGLMVFIVLSLVWIKPRKPGLISGLFGITYSIARVIGEQYRLPDAHIGYELFGLTRGQWLSFGLLAISIVLIIYSLKSPTKPMGGWTKAKDN